MQQWEYLQVAVHEHHWHDGRGRGGKLRAAGDSQAALEDLGLEGWELVGIASGQFSSTYRLFLRRPKE